MMVLKRLALAAALSLTACSAQLATLPHNDNYLMVEGDAPQLTSAEQEVVEKVNKRLVQLGLPQAIPGSYEQNAAAIIANAALAKVWHGSARAIAQLDPQEIAPPVSGQEKTEQKHEVANGRLASLTDEEDDAELKHLHVPQHMTAHLLPQSFRQYNFASTYAQTGFDDDEIKNVVRSIRPLGAIRGELKIGVAILPVGDADKRIFVVTLRDRVLDLTKGPSRFAWPGSTFEVAGTVFSPTLKFVRVGLLGPDGKVQLQRPTVDSSGNFVSTLTIPNAPGLYLLSVTTDFWDNHTITVPIFAGIQATPWPVSPDPNETPVDGTRTLVQKLAKAITEWRHSHGLPLVPIDANLSAFAKSESILRADAVDQSAGEGSGTPEEQVADHERDRERAAGYDHAQLSVWHNQLSQDYVNDYFARFPSTAFVAADLGSPTVRKIGVGAVLIPNTVTKDSDLVRYYLSFAIDDPNPPGESRTSNAPAVQPLTVTVRADGSASVDGAQVDDARLKQAIDTAKSTNADLTVVLQVEDGAKAEVVQHVTTVIKAEGVVNLVTNAASSSAPPTPPGTTPPAPAKTPPPTTSPPPGNW